ncbi:MAG: hypothetical protein KC449_10660 [Anaerolineales bacterium]|nr:hypothetical protein [Anaerolineales bacterium]
MTTWNDTIKTALLGTNRAELPTLPGNNALGQLLTQLPPQEDAASLLTVAGAVALHQQTGWQPRQTTARGKRPTAGSAALPTAHQLPNRAVAGRITGCLTDRTFDCSGPNKPSLAGIAAAQFAQ